MKANLPQRKNVLTVEAMGKLCLPGLPSALLSSGTGKMTKVVNVSLPAALKDEYTVREFTF